MKTTFVLLIVFVVTVHTQLLGQEACCDFEKGRIWVKMKHPLNSPYVSEFQKTIGIPRKALDLMNINNIKKVFNSDNKQLNGIYEISYNHEKDLINILNQYKNHIEYAERIPKIYTGNTNYYTPNDFIEDQNILWHIDHIGLRNAWHLMQGVNNRVKVVVIDNGFDGGHEDLVSNIVYMATGANNN